jgi:hypothetical protein
MERCNRDAWREYPNGYRVCLEHAQVNNPDERLYPNRIGPCDYPVDGHGAMRYDKRMRLAREKR